MIPMLLGAGFLSACAAPTINQDAICDGTRQARSEHTAALLADGGDLSLATGADLIARIDAGCRDLP